MGEGDPQAVSARLPGVVLQARDARGVGKPANAGPSKASRASVGCEVRKRGMPSPFSSFTDPSRGLSESVLRKPWVGGRSCTTLANDKYT
jgi:hypothetical protein